MASINHLHNILFLCFIALIEETETSFLWCGKIYNSQLIQMPCFKVMVTIENANCLNVSITLGL